MSENERREDLREDEGLVTGEPVTDDGAVDAAIDNGAPDADAAEDVAAEGGDVPDGDVQDEAGAADVEPAPDADIDVPAPEADKDTADDADALDDAPTPDADESTDSAIDAPAPDADESTDSAIDEPTPDADESTDSAIDAPTPDVDESTDSADDEPAPDADESTDSTDDEPAPEADTSDGEQASPEYDFDDAKDRLLALQQRVRASKIPVVIVIEGWAAAGKGTMAGELLEGLDPRGYHVHVREQESSDEGMYPPLRRYWVDMPKAGNIEIFIGSWYQEACAEAVDSKRGARRLQANMERFNIMERMLARDGVVILKFFINISQKEQKRRLKALESSKLTRSRVTKADKAQNAHYEEWRDVYNQMLAATNEPEAEWRVLPGKSKGECKRQLYSAVIEALEKALEVYGSGERPWDLPLLGEHEPVRVERIPPLAYYETAQTLDEPYKQAMDEAQAKLRKLQYELHRRGTPMILAFEGWDAAGKGGAIRRLSAALDPRGFTVVPIAAPTPEEKAHHHLWRFWRTLPRAGQIAIYDRTWYGRVMVERIEGFCTENQWKRAYEEINLFERDLVENGAIVLKFWLQISKDEQLRRFVDRRDTPDKQWKITEEDWRNRDKWPQYEIAVDEMLQKTNTHDAPWIVVEGDNKHFARLKVLNTVIAAVEGGLDRR